MPSFVPADAETDAETAAETDAGADAVRRYLLFLEDPSSVDFSAEVEKVNAQLAEQKDPLERLRLKGELVRLQGSHEDLLRAGFVAHAHAWATREGLPLSVFDDMGIPDAVMRQAHLRFRPRRPFVGRDDVLRWMLDQKEPFGVHAAQRDTGASHITVRRVLSDLVAAGELVDAGGNPAHQGRGRAARMFLPAAHTPPAPARRKRVTKRAAVETSDAAAATETPEPAPTAKVSRSRRSGGADAGPAAPARSKRTSRSTRQTKPAGPAEAIEPDMATPADVPSRRATRRKAQRVVGAGGQGTGTSPKRAAKKSSPRRRSRSDV